MLTSRITVLLFVAVVAATSDLRAGERRGSRPQPDRGSAVSSGRSDRPPPSECRQEVMPAKPRQCPNTEMATYNVCAGREPEFISCQ